MERSPLPPARGSTVKSVRILLIVASCLVCGARSYAHHRLSDIYREGQEISIEGDVVEWEYRNPHSFMHVVVRDARNRSQRWIVECRGADHLRRLGVTAGTVKPGQHVIVTGNPGRVAADRRLYLRVIVRPQDGLTWNDTLS
jgi:hypothetical protein